MENGHGWTFCNVVIGGLEVDVTDTVYCYHVSGKVIANLTYGGACAPIFMRGKPKNKGHWPGWTAIACSRGSHAL